MQGCFSGFRLHFSVSLFSRGIAISSFVVRGDCSCLFLGQHLNGRSRELDMTQYRREIQRFLLSNVKTVHFSGLLVFLFLFWNTLFMLLLFGLFYCFFCGGAYQCFLASATLGGLSYLTNFFLPTVYNCLFGITALRFWFHDLG